MMEEANVSKRHGDAVLVAGVDNIVITDATACFCYVFHTALVSTLDVVSRMGRKHRYQRSHPCSAQSTPSSPRGSMAQASL